MFMNANRGRMSMFLLLLVIVALTFAPQPGHTQGKKNPPQGEISKIVTKTVDPCQFASADQLKTLLSAGIGQYFPIKHSKSGHHITISDPTITNATCSPFKVTIKANIRYQDTRGFDQFSTSGDVRFTSTVVAKVSYKLVTLGEPVRADNLVKAEACLTDIQVTGLNLNNVPNWLDDGWVKDQLNKRLANQACFDITNLVKLYLQKGGTL